MTTLSACSSNNDNTVAIKATNAKFPPIPPSTGATEQAGLAGPITGAHGNYVLVAGGANFEGGLPWRGGKKLYHDEIYLMKKTGEANYEWEQATERLPSAMAYPACVSVDKGVLCIGGENSDGHPLSEVTLFAFADGKVSRTALPALPQATTSAGAAVIGSTVFVVGGLTSEGATSALYSLNIDDPTKGWQQLPDLPVALSHSVTASQSDNNNDCIYVIGGRNRTAEVSTFMSSVWKYCPSTQQWELEGDIMFEGKPLGLSAGTGIAYGHRHIVLFGGDPGIYFNRTERMNNALEKVVDENERQKIWQEKDQMLSSHPGFIKDVLAFDTHTKTWEKIGNLTAGSPVTTTAFMFEKTVLVPSGEIRPGVRTPDVAGIIIQAEK